MKRNRVTAVLAVALGALGLPAAAQASAYSDGVLASNPLTYLRLNETSGSKAFDETLNHNDGIYAGDFTLGAAGPFTDAGTSVKLGKTGKITADVPGPSGSVELWVNPDRMVKNPDVPLVAHGDPAGDGWSLGVGNRRKLAWRSGSKQVPTQVRLSNGVWTALTVTWDGSKVRFYRNGALAKTVNGVVTPASSNGKLVIAGDGNVVFSKPYSGQVDEVAVYRQVLSASDVAAHQAATHVPVNTSLPQVTGVASVGSTLSVLRGTWSNGGDSPIYKHQWQRCDSDGEQCADVPGATTSTYRLVDGDSCSIFQVVESVTNGNGQTASAVSNRTEAVEPCGVDAPAPENEQPPVIDDDTPAVDQSLTVARGIWSFIDDSTQF
jgi:hypothetical protein